MCRNHHPEKMCRNHHPEKNGKNRFDWKIKNGKPEKTGFNRKKWEMEKWESVTKMKKPKTLKEILIL